MDILLSGLLYLAVYTWTICITYIAEKKDRLSRKPSKVLAILIAAIIVPCLLAGMRDTSVGTDTGGYAINLMNYVIKSDSFAELREVDKTYTEIGYQFFVYIISRFCLRFEIVLFFTEFMILLPFIIAIFYVRKELSMTKCIAAFMFCYYHLSLNLMRQSIAMSLTILACILFAYCNKKVIAAFVITLAYFFHKFTLIIVLILFVAWILKRFLFNPRKRLLIFTAILGCPVFFIPIIFKISPLILTGAFQKFVKYVSGEQGIGILTKLRSPSFIIFTLLFISSWYSYTTSPKKKTKYDVTLLFLAFLTIECSFLQAFITYANRISYFLMPFFILFLARSFKFTLRFKEKDRAFFFYMLIVVYWLFNGMLSASSSTAIYKVSF